MGTKFYVLVGTTYVCSDFAPKSFQAFATREAADAACEAAKQQEAGLEEVNLAEWRTLVEAYEKAPSYKRPFLETPWLHHRYTTEYTVEEHETHS